MHIKKHPSIFILLITVSMPLITSAQTFSGDMNDDKHTLEKLAADSDMLLAHNAIPEETTGVARQLHMPPTVIGKIALQARAKQLVLSHRMQRTSGREQQTLNNIRQHYQGPIAFADDMDCFRP
jgi:ribonuclease BN (tRNA processing enzyme)